MDEILPRLNQIFEDVLEVDNLVLTRATTAQDVPGWDSVAHVRLMVETEIQLGVKFSTAEISSLKNVGELIDLIAARQQGKR